MNNILEPDQRRWGKHGVRLTCEQVAASNARGAVRRQNHTERDVRNTAVARRKWSAGLIVPCRITAALDSHLLFGPEVDRACKADEPDVDLWEAGKLYPRWEQVVALGELTGRHAVWFTELGHPLSVWDTSMRFHLPRHDLTPFAPPVVRYPDHVVARCPGTDEWSG